MPTLLFFMGRLDSARGKILCQSSCMVIRLSLIKRTSRILCLNILTLPRTSTLDLNFFHREGTDVSALDLRICKEEVWDTIGSLLAYRAPGPDGYTGRFYKPCWQLIKTLHGCHHCATTREFKECSTQHTSLLFQRRLRRCIARIFSQSLIHSFAKLITKILANCLAPLLITKWKGRLLQIPSFIPSTKGQWSEISEAWLCKIHTRKRASQSTVCRDTPSNQPCRALPLEGPACQGV